MAKKGIAVLSTSTGQPVHKLLDDGSAVIAEAGSAAAVSLNGDVLVENLNVKVKETNGVMLMDANGEDADNLAKVINGITNSLAKEITDADTARDQLDDDLDSLIGAAGFTPGTDTGVSAGVVTAIAPTFSNAGKRYISTAASMHAADEALSTECGTQAGELTTLENTTIPNAISTAKGTLVGDALDTLEEIANSVGNDTEFATTVVGEVGTAISQLQGTVTAADDTLQEVETLIGNEISRASPTAGAQKNLQDDIDDVQGSVGLTAAGALDGGDAKPAAADITLDGLIKGLQTDLSPLETNFFCTAMTVTGLSTMNGHMKCDTEGAGSTAGTFNFPTKNAAQAAAMASIASNNGKVFYLTADENVPADAAALAGTPFEDGKKLYFCENGVWHSSNLLKVEEGQ